MAVFLLLGALQLRGQDGTTAYNYLNITSSARIFGLGGINISTVADQLGVADQNPALLGPEMSGQIALDYMRYVGESNFAGVRYTHSCGEHASWAAGLRYFGYGEMKEADASGVVTGTFSPKDVTFSGAYSRDLSDQWRGGFNLKLLYSSYAEFSAFAVAVDLGLNYYDPDRDLSFSIVGANLGGQIKKFDNTYDRLPIDVRLGLTKGLESLPLRLNVTAWNLTKWKLPYWDSGDGTTADPFKKKDKFMSNLFRHLVFGVELVPSDRFFASLGYNYKTRTDMATYSRSFLSGFSLAAGMNVRNFSFSVGFAQPHTGATTFMFNLGLNLQDLLH